MMIIEGKLLKLKGTDKGVSYLKIKTLTGTKQVGFPKDFSGIEKRAILKQDVKYGYINLNKMIFKKPDWIRLDHKYSLKILTGLLKDKKFEIQSGVIGYKDNKIFDY